MLNPVDQKFEDSKQFLPLRPGRISLALFVFLTVLSILVPPFQGPDERNHFFRVFQISEFSMVPEAKYNGLGIELPNAVVQSVDSLQGDIPFNRHIKFKPDVYRSEVLRTVDYSSRSFVSFPNTALYSPVAYGPYVFGVWIGRIFELAPVFLFFFSRLCGVLSATLLFYLILRIVPQYWSFFVPLFFLPMFAFQLSTISADNMSFCLANLLLALTVRILPKGEQIQRAEFYAFVAFCFGLLLLSKQAYFPLIVPFLFFSTYCCIKLKMHKLFLKILVYFVLFSIPALFWNLTVGNMFVSLRDDVVISPKDQGRFIIANIPYFINISINTILTQAPELWQQFVGVFGWLDAPLPRVTNHILGFGVFFCGFLTFLKTRFSFPIRIVFVVTSVFQIFVIVAFIYLSWNPVGHGVVEGLQGRYFLPTSGFFLAFFGAGLSSIFRSEQTMRKIEHMLIILTFALISISAWTSVSAILNRYY